MSTSKSTSWPVGDGIMNHFSSVILIASYTFKRCYLKLILSKYDLHIMKGRDFRYTVQSVFTNV